MTPERIPWFKTKNGIRMIVTPFIVFGLAWAFVLFEDFKAGRHDTAAYNDAERLGGAIARVNSELRDEGCPELIKSFSQEHLKYVLSQYYGWAGTTATSDVVARLVDSEIWVCAKRGRTQDGDETKRKIFRIDLTTGALPPPIVGPCEGEEYGRRGQVIYTNSMVDTEDGKCRLIEPKDYIDD